MRSILQISKEPKNLTEWEPCVPLGHGGRLFTCGRPGRATFGTCRARVDDDTVQLWLKGLPAAEMLHIVSLLGRKKDGFSEFAYYSFRSARECGGKPTFQQWLNARYGQRFVVHEFPTMDAQGIPKGMLQRVTDGIRKLIKGGKTVVVVDSGGAARTVKVAKAIGYTKK